jgi:hypothetical protein
LGYKGSEANWIVWVMHRLSLHTKFATPRYYRC